MQSVNSTDPLLRKSGKKYELNRIFHHRQRKCLLHPHGQRRGANTHHRIT